MPPPGTSRGLGGAGAGSGPGSGSGVQVLVRVRPPLPRELMYDSSVVTNPPYDVKVFNASQEFSGRYHGVFGEEATQAEVYSAVRDCVPLALDGYNSTVFAYGQTGTGKTYTMMGDDPAVDGGAGESPPRVSVRPPGCGGPGIIPRAIKELFREAKAKQDAEGAAIQVIVSYMEIYNDRLHDLLQPYKPTSTRDPADMNQKRALLEVREDGRGNTYVPNLLCVKVKSYKSVYQLVAKGNRNRAVRHTEMNQASSRSHAILQIVIEQWPNGGADGTCLRSKLNFVDLAGSERWNKDMAAAAGWDGGPALYGEERVSEMTAINGSLSALGSVVAALTERRPHVPYRDSRLTHLLQDSLGGNCRTTLLATLSPSADAFEESCSTLRFADRARAIANNPVVNASRDVGSILALKEREIQRLRNMLTVYATTGGAAPGDAAGGGGGDAGRLAEELEATRRALDMERALRAELQQRLHGGGSSGSVGSSGGAGGNLNDTISGGGGGGGGGGLGTPSTAFDLRSTAATPTPMSPSGVLTPTRAGGPARPWLHSAGEDYTLAATPDALQSPPMSAAGGGRAGAAVRKSTMRSGSNSRGTSRFASGGSGGGAGGTRSGGAASPARASASMADGFHRRLSYDEAMITMQSQVINLSHQEKERMRARQPQRQQHFWGSPQRTGGVGRGSTFPPPGAAAVERPPFTTSTALDSPPRGSHGKPLNGRTRTAKGLYGSGGKEVQAGPPVTVHPSRPTTLSASGQYGNNGGYGASPYGSGTPPSPYSRPPPVSVGAGVGTFGGGGRGGHPAAGGPGGAPQVVSIDMVDSPMGSDIVSPGVHTLIHRDSRSAHGKGQEQQQPWAQPPAQPQRQPPPKPKTAPPAPAAPPPLQAHSLRSSAESLPEEEEAAAVSPPARAAPDRSAPVLGARRSAVQEEEEEVVAEEESPKPPPAANRKAGGRSALTGGGATGAGSTGTGEGKKSSGGDDDGGLSDLDPDEYEEVMRLAREAIDRAMEKKMQEEAATVAASAAAAGAGGGGGGGRSALMPGSAPAVGAAPGWGRNALLSKFADSDGGGVVGTMGAGAASFGRSSLMAAAPPPPMGMGMGMPGMMPLGMPGMPLQAMPMALPGMEQPIVLAVLPGMHMQPPVQQQQQPAPPSSAPAAAPSGGWGRRSILAQQSSGSAQQPGAVTGAAVAAAAAAASAHAAAAAAVTAATGSRGSGSRRALVDDLMAEDDGGGAPSPYGAVSPSPSRQRVGGSSSGGKGRSKSVGTIGRPNGGSRGSSRGGGGGNTKMDAGSWIYILGSSASSTRAKQLAAALQLDPRTGLPAL